MKKTTVKKNNKGAAMILTIVIMTVLIIFIFSLILVSYNLYASQNKNLSSTRNSEAVNSLSNSIMAEITDDDAMGKSNLYRYLRTNLAYNPGSDSDWKDWPYYDENALSGQHTKEAAFRYFTLESNSSIEGLPAQTTVCMYWTIPQEVAADTFYENIKNGASPKGIMLHVIISAQTASQYYETEDVYKLLVRNSAPEEEVLIGNAFNDTWANPANHTCEASDKGEKWIWKYVSKH